MSQTVLDTPPPPRALTPARRETGDPLAGLSATDRRLFWQLGVGPSAPLPHRCVHHAFEEQAAAHPDAIAVEHLGDTITYGELDRQANRLAALLAAHGVRPGDNVAPVRAALDPDGGRHPGHAQGRRRVRPAGRRRRAASAQLRHVVDDRLHPGDLDPGRPARTWCRCPTATRRIAVDTFMDEPRRRATATRPAPPRRAPSRRRLLRAVHLRHHRARPTASRSPTATSATSCSPRPGDLGIRPGWRVGADPQRRVRHGGLGDPRLPEPRRHARDPRRGHHRDGGRDVDVVIATPTRARHRSTRPRARSVKVVAVAGEPCPRPLADRWAGMSHVLQLAAARPRPRSSTRCSATTRARAGSRSAARRRTTPSTSSTRSAGPCPIGETGEMWAGGDCVSAGYLAQPRAQRRALRAGPVPRRRPA